MTPAEIVALARIQARPLAQGSDPDPSVAWRSNERVLVCLETRAGTVRWTATDMWTGARLRSGTVRTKG